MASKLNEASVQKLSPRYLAAIGRVATEWARLEYFINVHIWIMAGSDADTGAAITAQITSIIPRMGAVLALLNANGASKKTIEKATAYFQKLHGLSAGRNRIIHDPWLKGATSRKHYRIEIDTRKGFVFQHKPTALKDIQDCADRIVAAQDDFIRLYHDVIVKDQAYTGTLLSKLASRAALQSLQQLNTLATR